MTLPSPDDFALKVYIGRLCNEFGVSKNELRSFFCVFNSSLKFIMDLFSGEAGDDDGACVWIVSSLTVSICLLNATLISGWRFLEIKQRIVIDISMMVIVENPRPPNKLNFQPSE